MGKAGPSFKQGSLVFIRPYAIRILPDAVEVLQKEPGYEEAKKELEAFQATHPDFDELSDDILVFLRKGDTLPGKKPTTKQ